MTFSNVDATRVNASTLKFLEVINVCADWSAYFNVVTTSSSSLVPPAALAERRRRSKISATLSFSIDSNATPRA